MVFLKTSVDLGGDNDTKSLMTTGHADLRLTAITQQGFVSVASALVTCGLNFFTV
ncbi:hypothetical protein OSCI_850008 [Kamptonema sp. PCC 6506]|nr:hypothetical protein OSCI_850008 [Kamptonema sp. PCC 6506]